MKRLLIAASALLTLIIACRNQEKNEFFPVLSFLQSQVKHVDTSVYSIIKIITVDSVSDTVFIKREDFRGEAQEFLSIPDLTLGKYTSKFEENKNYDPEINRAVFSYYPKSEKQEIRRQEVTITPGSGGDDKVRNVYIEKRSVTKDSIVIKRLHWIVNESCMIITLVQKDNATDKVYRKEIIWNRPTESGL
jgi:hypothetical protein